MHCLVSFTMAFIIVRVNNELSSVVFYLRYR